MNIHQKSFCWKILCLIMNITHKTEFNLDTSNAQKIRSFIGGERKFARSTSCAENQRKVGTKATVDFFVSKVEKNWNRANYKTDARRLVCRVGRYESLNISGHS